MNPSSKRSREESLAERQQSAFLAEQREAKRQRFIRALKADDELTYGQIRERFGFDTEKAKALAAEAGLTIAAEFAPVPSRSTGRARRKRQATRAVLLQGEVAS